MFYIYSLSVDFICFSLTSLTRLTRLTPPDLALVRVLRARSLRMYDIVPFEFICV